MSTWPLIADTAFPNAFPEDLSEEFLSCDNASHDSSSQVDMNVTETPKFYSPSSPSYTGGPLDKAALAPVMYPSDSLSLPSPCRSYHYDSFEENSTVLDDDVSEGEMKLASNVQDRSRVSSSKSRAFSCCLCTMTCPTKMALQGHLAFKHKMQAPSMSRAKVHLCPLCNDASFSRLELARHLKASHRY